MQNANDMLIFAKVAELGGISAAARALQIPKSKVSRRMAMLEAELDARLLERSTRAVHLTEAGRIYYQHCRQIVEAMESAENSVHQLTDTPRGQLRISASVTTGQQMIAPYLNEFTDRYPLIEIDLELSNRRVDLISEGFDLAIRIGELEDSNLISKRLGSGRAGLFAAKQYLEQNGRPGNLEALRQHRTLVMSHSEHLLNWHLINNKGQSNNLDIHPNIRINDLDALITAVAGGCGISCLPTYLVQHHPRGKELEQILPGWHAPEVNFYALYPSLRGLTHKARLWIDFFSDKLSGQLDTKT